MYTSSIHMCRDMPKGEFSFVECVDMCLNNILKTPDKEEKKTAVHVAIAAARCYCCHSQLPQVQYKTL